MHQLVRCVQYHPVSDAEQIHTLKHATTNKNNNLDHKHVHQYHATIKGQLSSLKKKDSPWMPSLQWHGAGEVVLPSLVGHRS